MTSIAASTPESPAAQRLMTFRRMGELLRKLDHAQVAADIPPSLAARLNAPRYRARLERRFARQTGLIDASEDLHAETLSRIVDFGSEGLRALIVDSGTLCQYAALRRIVDQAFLADLSKQTGLNLATHEARKATNTLSMNLARAIAAPEPPVTSDAEDIIHAILAEGLQCWTCWIQGQPPGLQHFYEALLPMVPRRGTDVAGISCKPHECRRRAELFETRIKAALPEQDEASQGSA